MALSDLLRVCSKNIPGIAPDVFTIPIGRLKAINTNASGEITKIETDTASGSAPFTRIQADIDSVQFIANGEFKTSGAYEQSLVLGLAKPRAQSVNFVSDLRDAISCGVAVAYFDNNGQGWLWGANTVDREGFARPVNAMEVNLDTGKELTDEDSQRIQITLKRISGHLPSPLAAGIKIANFVTATTVINDNTQ